MSHCHWAADGLRMLALYRGTSQMRSDALFRTAWSAPRLLGLGLLLGALTAGATRAGDSVSFHQRWFEPEATAVARADDPATPVDEQELPPIAVGKELRAGVPYRFYFKVDYRLESVPSCKLVIWGLKTLNIPVSVLEDGQFPEDVHFREVVADVPAGEGAVEVSVDLETEANLYQIDFCCLLEDANTGHWVVSSEPEEPATWPTQNSNNTILEMIRDYDKIRQGTCTRDELLALVSKYLKVEGVLLETINDLDVLYPREFLNDIANKAAWKAVQMAYESATLSQFAGWVFAARCVLGGLSGAVLGEGFGEIVGTAALLYTCDVVLYAAMYALPSDQGPPTVTDLVVSPNDGGDPPVVYGVVQVIARMSDETGVTQSRLMIDGKESMAKPYAPIREGEFIETFNWDTGEVDDGIHEVWVEADDPYGKTSPYGWVVRVRVLNNGHEHDYEIVTVTPEPLAPEEGKQVTVRAVLRNVGRSSEGAGVPVRLYVDGAQKNSTTTVSALPRNGEGEVALTWTAVKGLHLLKVQAFLPSDGEPNNDWKSTLVSVGSPGALLVNGSAAPTTRFTSPSGQTTSGSAELHNRGGSPLTVTVTKSGQVASWIRLSEQTVSIWTGWTATYPYEIVVPAGTSIGTYTAQILFDYGEGAVPLNVTVEVSSSTSGMISKTFSPSSGTIDGRWQSTSSYTHANWELLDNDDGTPAPMYYEADFNLGATSGNSDLARADTATWYIGGDEEAEHENSGLLISDSGDVIQTWSSDFSTVALDVMKNLRTGENQTKVSLNNFAHGDANVRWRVLRSEIVISESVSAWSCSTTFSDSELAAMSTSWDTGCLKATVESVSQGGSVHLWIAESGNGHGLVKRRTISVSSGDVGREVSWLLTESWVDSNNVYFCLKGDRDQGTRVTLSNIRVEIKHFSGDPALECTKTLSAGEIVVGQSATVQLRFENVGTNMADEINYNDAPLPSGVSLMSGSLSGDVGWLDPGQNTSASYSIRGDVPGVYTFGDTLVAYENRDGSKTFQSSFSPVTLKVGGGDLQVTGSAEPTEGQRYGIFHVHAQVTESVGGSAVMDAQVVARLTNPAGTSFQVPLFVSVPRTTSSQATDDVR